MGDTVNGDDVTEHTLQDIVQWLHFLLSGRVPPRCDTSVRRQWLRAVPCRKHCHGAHSVWSRRLPLLPEADTGRWRRQGHS